MKNLNTAILKQGSFVAAGLLLLPSTAAACGMCVFELFDYSLPHIVGWSFGMMVWFFAVMISCIGEKRLSFSSRPFLDLAAALFSVLLGVVYFGPLPFFLLGLIAACITCKAFAPNLWSDLSKKLQTRLKIVSFVAVACMLVGIIFSMRTAKMRSDADFILQWGGGITLHGFTASPEEHEATLRDILGLAI